MKGGSFRRHRGEEAKRNGELQRDEVVEVVGGDKGPQILLARILYSPYRECKMTG